MLKPISLDKINFKSEQKDHECEQNSKMVREYHVTVCSTISFANDILCFFAQEPRLDATLPVLLTPSILSSYGLDVETSDSENSLHKGLTNTKTGDTGLLGLFGNPETLDTIYSLDNER